MEGGKKESARKVIRISTLEVVPVVPVDAETDELTQASLNKKKVSELIVLLRERTGKIVNSKTRKQDIIDTLVNSCTRSEWVSEVSSGFTCRTRKQDPIDACLAKYQEITKKFL